MELKTVLYLNVVDVIRFMAVILLCEITEGERLVDVQTDRDCPTRVDPRIFFSGSSVPTGLPRRARLTVPRGLSLAPSSIPGAGRGILSRIFIPKYTWLGEYEGDFVPLNYTCADQEYAWTVNKYGVTSELAGVHYYVDAMDERVSNWLRYINCARHHVEENVGSLQCYGRRYYVTTRDVAPGQELLVYYGRDYALKLGIEADEFYNRDFWYHGRRSPPGDRLGYDSC